MRQPHTYYKPRNVEAILRQALGSSLKHLWKLDPASVTLGPGNRLDGILDAVTSGAVNAVRFTGTAFAVNFGTGTHTWNASGGPNGRPYAHIDHVNGLLIAGDTTTISAGSGSLGFAAGNRIGIYMVLRNAGGAAAKLVAGPRQSNNSTHSIIGQSATPAHRMFLGFSDGSSTDPTITAPAFDTNWHLYAIRPLATGALAQIDGSGVTAPMSGSLGAQELTAFQWGHSLGTASGGDYAMTLLVDNPTDEKDVVIREYVQSVFGL